MPEVDEEERDVKVNSLYPKGPATAFKYPARSDELYVPIQHILMKVTMTTANRHRDYTLDPAIQDMLNNQVYIICTAFNANKHW